MPVQLSCVESLNKLSLRIRNAQVKGSSPFTSLTPVLRNGGLLFIRTAQASEKMPVQLSCVESLNKLSLRIRNVQVKGSSPFTGLTPVLRSGGVLFPVEISKNATVLLTEISEILRHHTSVPALPFQRGQFGVKFHIPVSC